VFESCLCFLLLFYCCRPIVGYKGCCSINAKDSSVKVNPFLIAISWYKRVNYFARCCIEYCGNKVRRAGCDSLEFSDKIPNAIVNTQNPHFRKANFSGSIFKRRFNKEYGFWIVLLLADYCAFLQKRMIPMDFHLTIICLIFQLYKTIQVSKTAWMLSSHASSCTV
jgi:hypothetical protein